jgi:hypothetical protein
MNTHEIKTYTYYIESRVKTYTYENVYTYEHILV